MAQYIDKDALVAEIEQRIDELCFLLPDACNTGKYTALESFRKYIDTLEVKEVDIDKEIQDHIMKCLDVELPKEIEL